MAQEMALWTPSTDLSIAQQGAKSATILKWSTSPQEALKAAKMLVGSWPNARPPDADGWAASLAAALAAYPLGLVQECCDPRTGLAKTREFPPTVASINEWCEKRLKYHRGMVGWAAMKKADEPQFSETHERGMLERLQDLMHGLFDKKPQQVEAAE